MNTYTIESGIPLPCIHAGRRAKDETLTAGALEPGQSFVCAYSARMSNMVAQLGKRHGKKFTTRKLDDGTMRIWRVS